MNANQIVEIWTTFKEHIDKKSIETIAESYVDLMADYGTEDHHFRDCLGTCDILDNAIGYYLDETAEDVYDDEDGYDDWDE